MINPLNRHLGGPSARQVQDQSRSPVSGSSDSSEDGVDAGLLNRHTPPHSTVGARFAGCIQGLVAKAPAKFRLRKDKKLVSCLIAALAMILILAALLAYFNVHLRQQIPHNDIQRIIASWASPNSSTEGEAHYPTDFSRDVIPIPCHSHNDYWRKVPLYDALAAGCTGVEADVWLSNGDLLVGHSRGSLTSSRSLRSLYIDPLVSILSHQNLDLSAPGSPLNGVFETSPGATLVLLIDIKTHSTETLPVVLDQLSPLRSRGFLTFFNGSTVVPGPVTVVGTGNTAFDQLMRNHTYRDIFFDAPLADLWGEDAPITRNEYDISTSYYASVSFAEAVGKPSFGILTPDQVDVLRGQVQAASAKGLKARYWDTPAWPVSLRNHVWDVLVKEGVGMLNVDDLDGASKRKW